MESRDLSELLSFYGANQNFSELKNDPSRGLSTPIDSVHSSEILQDASFDEQVWLDLEPQNEDKHHQFNRNLTFDLIRRSSDDFSSDKNFKKALNFGQDFESYDFPEDLQGPLNRILDNTRCSSEATIETTGKFSPCEEEKTPANSKQKSSKVGRNKSKRVPKEYDPETKARVKKSTDSKNIVKNYGKAICAFCLSEAGKPYLSKSLQAQGANFQEFKKFVINSKETIDSIDRFRVLLCPNSEYDSEEESQCKLVFRDMSEHFIRDFAVNWIFSSRAQNKYAHLGYRFKMLRRVKNPDTFTFLKSQKLWLKDLEETSLRISPIFLCLVEGFENSKSSGMLVRETAQIKTASLCKCVKIGGINQFSLQFHKCRNVSRVIFDSKVMCLYISGLVLLSMRIERPQL